jgi:hypothetical protein
LSKSSLSTREQRLVTAPSQTCHLSSTLRLRTRDAFDCLVFSEMGLNLVTPHPANNFALRIELTDVVAGIVTITNARRMLSATVLEDVAGGIRFKTCKRRDCPKPFPIQSKHKQDYCRQYCGHLASQRRKRAAEQRRRPTKKKRRKKSWR